MRRLAIIFTIACASVPRVAPIPMVGTEPPEYRLLYAKMESCLGMKGDYYGVTFYSDSSGRHYTKRFNGRWEPGSIVIYAKQLANSMVVSHEIIHDITKSSNHPRKYFLNRCGDYSLGEVLD